MSEIFLELKNVYKSFGKVLALEDVSLKIENDEIVGLIGDNGAGKSTLVKIISGIHTMDSGEVFLYGKKVEKWETKNARSAGIETVYQDQALSGQQSLYSNIFMGREICNSVGYVNIKKEKKETERLMKEMGFRSSLLTPDTVILNCSGGEREGVAISRAMYFKANLVILDEPTTALSIKETQKVINFVRKIKERGSSCIFIAHNIYYVYEVADRFTIMDKGRIVDDVPKTNITYNELIDRMTYIASEDRK